MNDAAEKYLSILRGFVEPTTDPNAKPSQSAVSIASLALLGKMKHNNYTSKSNILYANLNLDIVAFVLSLNYNFFKSLENIILF